jgi:hypothetical protein
MVSSLQGFFISPIRATCPARLLLDFVTVILLGEARHYALYPSWVPIFSSVSRYQTPPITFVLPSMCDTKFHNHTKQQAKLYFVFFMFTFTDGREEDKYSEQNCRELSPDVTCSEFLRKCDFYLLVLFPNIRRIY